MVSALEMKGITKTYPGVVALQEVDFTLAKGEVHALLGENGAGKSTLMKILAGAQPMDSGAISIDGKPVRIVSPHHALALGVSIIYQEFNLVPGLTVAENIFLGREPESVSCFVSYRTMFTQAQDIIDRLGVKIDVRKHVDLLSVAEQQMVEIAKAVSRNSAIIAMDEPTATLTDHEISRLFALIRSLKDHGASTVYISHRLEEIFEIADSVTVLRDGKRIGTLPVADIDQDGLIRMMVGRELSEVIPKQIVDKGPPALQARNLVTDKLKDVSFAVHHGEILGFAGLVGAGRTELARAIFGADPMESGDIRIDGQPASIRSPVDAIRHGIGFATEDRKGQGLVLDMNLRENVSMASLPSLSSMGFISQGRERDTARQYIADLAIRATSCEQTTRDLSGGNQQKVVLAKWLCTRSRVIIFDEPTRGIDVGAKIEIYNLMNRLVAQGAAIVMISSELQEILGMSDRILVMREGRIAGELLREHATQESIMRLAIGADSRVMPS